MNDVIFRNGIYLEGDIVFYVKSPLLIKKKMILFLYILNV